MVDEATGRMLPLLRFTDVNGAKGSVNLAYFGAMSLAAASFSL